MSSKSWSIVFALLGITLVSQLDPQSGFGHDGRRFELLVVGGQIVAQGENTGADDGAPAVRPYTNSIHDHWSNSPLGLPNALATLPAFEVPHFELSLVGQPLYLTLDSVTRWESPPMMPAPGTPVELTSLADDELLKIDTGLGMVDSESGGTALLTASVPVGGIEDLDLLYTINKLPTNEIHVLQVTISSGNNAITPSDPIYILLSPDGATPVERLHHASLYLEQAIHAVGVPEPATHLLLLTTLLLSFSHRNSFRSPRRTHSLSS